MMRRLFNIWTARPVNACGRLSAPRCPRLERVGLRRLRVASREQQWRDAHNSSSSKK